MDTLQAIAIGLFVNLITPIFKIFRRFFYRTSEVDKISKRLNQVLKLMNKSRDQEITIAELSKILNFRKISDLEKYFLNEEEPTFDFLEILSNEFALNISWLTQGKENPFKYDEDHYIQLYDDCLKKIEKLNPEIIYFVRADSINGETCILLEINEYKSFVLNTFVHFSAINGYGGMRQLVDLRKLIRHLILEKNMITKSLMIPKGIFSNLFNGKIHPSVVIQKRIGTFQHWHDDFTDLYNQRYGYKHHEEYDQNFKDAFRITKSHIEKYEES